MTTFYGLYFSLSYTLHITNFLLDLCFNSSISLTVSIYEVLNCREQQTGNYKPKHGPKAPENKKSAKCGKYSQKHMIFATATKDLLLIVFW